jgi:hypothetical protein
MTIMRHHLKSIGDESGLALIAALLLLASFTAIGAFAFDITMVNEEVAGHLRASKRAFYLAEADLSGDYSKWLPAPRFPPAYQCHPKSGGWDLSGDVHNYTDYPSVLIYRRHPVSGHGGKCVENAGTLVTKTYDLTNSGLTIRGTRPIPPSRGITSPSMGETRMALS